MYLKRKIGMKFNIIYILINYILIQYFFNKQTILYFMFFVSVSAGICIIDAIKKKYYIFLLFESIIYELLAVIIFRKFVLGLEENSWRLTYDNIQTNIISCKYIMCSLLIIMFFHTILSVMDKNCTFNIEMKKIKLSSSKLNIYFLLMIIFITIYMLKENIFLTRGYSVNQNVTLLSIYRIIFSIYILFYLSAEYICIIHKYMARFIFIIYMAVAIILGAISGYRFVIVEIFILIVIQKIFKIKKMSFFKIFMIIIIFLGAYAVFTFIKYIYIGNNNISFNQMLFNHERNIFYSLNAIIENTSTYSPEINTYMESFKNLLPRIITKSNSLNTGGILMQYITSNDSNINMGGFYLTEAYFVFSSFGIFLISVIISIIMLILEKLKYKYFKGIYRYFYIFVVSQTMNIAYYGSSNYMKIILYYLICLTLYSYYIKITTVRSTNIKLEYKFFKKYSTK